MRRLRDYQMVQVAADGRFERECHLVAIRDEQALLLAHTPVPPIGPAERAPGTMRFTGPSGHTVVLMGWVVSGPQPDSVRFIPNDGASLGTGGFVSRLAITLDALVVGSERRGNRTLDVSERQITFVDPLPAIPGQPVAVEITPPGYEEPLRLQGRVLEPVVAQLDPGEQATELGAFVIACRRQIARWAVEQHAQRAEALSGRPRPRAA